MLRTLQLVLPTILPSWAFFKAVEASPRIEYWIEEDGPFWREFRPRPARLSVRDILRRLIWNPHWNEQLYLVSCAERLMIAPTQHSVNQIEARLREALCPECGERRIRFRLVFVSDVQGHLDRSVEFESETFVLSAAIT